MLRGTDAVRRQLQSLLRTDIHTASATDTFRLLIEFLRLDGPPFRIMTPHTSEGAAFEENGSPDAGAIIDRIAFDIKYQCHLFHLI